MYGCLSAALMGTYEYQLLQCLGAVVTPLSHGPKLFLDFVEPRADLEWASIAPQNRGFHVDTPYREGCRSFVGSFMVVFWLFF